VPPPKSTLRLERRRDGQLWALTEDRECPVRVSRCFPWSEPNRFISLRDFDDEEAALVSEVSDLDEDSRAMLEQALAEAGFVLTIERIESIDEEIEIRCWRVRTRSGRRYAGPAQPEAALGLRRLGARPGPSLFAIGRGGREARLFGGTAGFMTKRDDAGRRAVALTIAGSDSGGGAGIQADLKTFHRFGVFGTSALTLVTAQNTVGVRDVQLLSPRLVASQIAAVAEDFDVRAAKTGALGSAELIEAVAGAIARHRIPNLVVDPVMVSKHGEALLARDAVDALRRQLLPRAALVTPNLHEAAALLGENVENEDQMRDAARALRDTGAAAVLIKGGHLTGGEAVDVFYDGTDFMRLAAPRIDTPHTHGTGCTYSAAVVALLARGEPLGQAIRQAKDFITRAIANAPGLGKGHGPLDHWA
jgi:hydroxymethylpyrimidine/phosphomethylpyrimidine kinase